MQHLYQGACDTNTLYQIVQRFIEITTPDRFIPIMHLFQHSCFFYNRDGFFGMLSECLQRARIERCNFVAECIMHCRRFEFEKLLWASLPNAVDRQTVTFRLLHELQIQVLGLFLSHRTSCEQMIQSCSDPQELFFTFLSLLVKASDDSNTKLRIFHRMCETFSRSGFDVLQSLSNHTLAAEIQSWYTLDAQDIYWPALKLLRPDLFYPTLFAYIKAIFGKSQFISFYELSQLLEEVDNKSEFYEKLFEQAELVETLRCSLTKNLASALSQETSAKSYFPLIQKLVPDWQGRLKTWTHDEGKREKDRALSYGKSPTFHEIDQVFKTLSILGVLDEWLLEAENSIDELCLKLHRTKIGDDWDELMAP